MGLFDFLKNKPAPATPTPPATPNPVPAAPGAAPASAPASNTSSTSSTGGPRYQGAKFTAPAAAPAPPAPRLPEPPPLPFEPTNVLEQLLLLAATDENARPAFYQALLQEEILMVLAPQEGTLAPGEVTLTEGQEIQLQVLSDGKLPVFSSEARLRDGNLAGTQVSFVRVPGAAFFNMVQGQDCVLNPFSPAGKLLPKDELAALLAGQLSGGLAPGAPDGAETQVQLTQPAAYPPGLTEALQAYCATNPTITAAYLAEMTVAEAPDAAPAGPAPRLLLAFDTTAPDPSFLQQLGPVLDGKTGPYQFVDLMLLDVNSEEGVNPYFRTIEPVYRRA